MFTIKTLPGKGIDNDDDCTVRGDAETYHQFHRPPVIWERMIIARGLDSDDTKASDEYIRSALSGASLRLGEANRAVRRLPKNAPPKRLTRVTFIISTMKGRVGGIEEGKGSSYVLHVSPIDENDPNEVR
jgi:hypothetical protein